MIQQGCNRFKEAMELHNKNKCEYLERWIKAANSEMIEMYIYLKLLDEYNIL